MEKYIGKKVKSVKNLNINSGNEKKYHCLIMDDGTEIHSNDYKLEFADYNIYLKELNDFKSVK